MLPQEATLHMLESSGHEAFDRFDFTHCRSFSTQSELRFTEVDASKVHNPSPPEGPNGAVPPFLPVTLRLSTAITDRDAVGALIQARVSGEVRHKGKVVMADGANVRGRIRRLEHRGEKQDFLVALEFTEVETADGPVRFFADFLKMAKNPKISRVRSEPVLVSNGRGGVESRTMTVSVPELPGVASFFVLGKSFTLPAGFQMMWRTRGLIRGQ